MEGKRVLSAACVLREILELSVPIVHEVVTLTLGLIHILFYHYVAYVYVAKTRQLGPWLTLQSTGIVRGRLAA